MRYHTVPHLDECPTSRIVVLDEPLARTAARSVKDAGNDRTKNVAERRGLVRVGLALIYASDRHEHLPG